MLRLGLLLGLALFPTAHAGEALYSPRGVGGGGALAGYSISPYSDLRFVGTDMGTLFRSVDRGRHWTPVDQTQVGYNSDLSRAADVGFSADPGTVFFADAGRNPKRSRDGGVSWSSINIPLGEKERILYWVADSLDARNVLCATNEGLFRTTDQGGKWVRVEGVTGKSEGTAFVGEGVSRKIFHATENEIEVADGSALHFQKWFAPPGTHIRAFAGGSDAHGRTLAFIDTQGKEACAWAAGVSDDSAEKKAATVQECGWVWIDRTVDGKSRFTRTRKEGGRFIRMAENNSQTIYLTGGDWARQYGSKVWVSRDAGTTWPLRLNIFDWDVHPYRPWPKDKLEFSAVGLDNGWNDNAPFSFATNRRDASEAGATGHSFLHITRDFGEHWRAPFTQFADTGEPSPQKKWKSTGLEVTSALRLKFHPRNSKLGYAAVADLGGIVTEDGGLTWRISKAKYNTNYDYAFDPAKPDAVFTASGDLHDFPLGNNTAIQGEGGIFSSSDRGHHWKRLTPVGGPLGRQFLSVAYDPIHHTLYGGTQGGGVARSLDGGTHWAYFNIGFPEGDRIIPQLEIDPRDGAAYALLTGNAPAFTNAQATGIYRLAPGANNWELLRKVVSRPDGVDSKHPLWLFPSAFAVDFTRPKRDVLWIADIENQGAWLATGIWKSTNTGNTWKRVTQFTHPTAITLDPRNPQAAYASGPYDVTGNWGVGGALSTLDGGKTWKKNLRLPLQANLDNFTPDPRDPRKGFYLFFGGGIFYGPREP